MQRKAQPFQGSLQIKKRTLLVSDVGEGYSLIRTRSDAGGLCKARVSGGDHRIAPSCSWL